MIARIAYVSVVLLIFVAQTPARGSSGDVALAEGLFQQARKLMAENRLPEACSLFANSQRIEPKLGTLLNLAVCHERLGKTATAWAEYAQAAAMAQRLGQPERKLFAEHAAGRLRPLLPHVLVTWTEPAPNQKLFVDGLELDAGAIGAPLPIDPGEHLIEVSAPGKRAHRQRISIEAQSSERPITIPKLEDENAANSDAPLPTNTPTARMPSLEIPQAAARPAAKTAPVRATRPTINPSHSKQADGNARSNVSTRRKFAYVIGAVGLGFGIAAVGVGLWNDARHSEWQETQQALDPEWKGEQPARPNLQSEQNANDERIRSVHRWDRATLGFGIAAGSLIATSAFLWITDKGSHAPRVGAAPLPAGGLLSYGGVF